MKLNKFILMTIILLIISTSIFIYAYLMKSRIKTQPTITKPGESEEEFWLNMAKIAWRYFQPGVSVNPFTGLHGAGLYWPYFTEWDLGVYLQAILDAWDLGILKADGEWGANYRIEKILEFLENRKLGPNNIPYLWYDSRTGKPYGNKLGNPYDSGKLLIALHNLKKFRPDLTERIDNIVKVRTNYRSLAERIGSGIYGWYAANGFKFFGYDDIDRVKEALTWVDNLARFPKVITYGISIPKTHLISEPALHALFELPPDDNIEYLVDLIYNASLARYEAIGEYTAFSEGNTDLDNPSYVYEYIALPDGRTWVILTHSGNLAKIPPIIYLKVAMAFHAIYRTEYTKSMLEYLLSYQLETDSGFRDGIDESGRIVKTVIDKTQGIILEAARYALMYPSLRDYPYPFIKEGRVNNTLIVIGESKSRFKLDPSHTIDVLGAVSIASYIGLSATSGAIKAAMDGWIVKYNMTTGELKLLDTSSNIICIGSPGVNLLSYYYNITGELPILFFRGENATSNYIYVRESKNKYYMEFNEDGKLIADYGAIIFFKDSYGRYVILAYGIGADATLAASEILRNPGNYPLWGSAIIFKFYASKEPGKLDTIEIIEHLT